MKSLHLLGTDFASTLLYIHLSGRELSAKLAAGMEQIHSWRVQQLGEVQR